VSLRVKLTALRRFEQTMGRVHHKPEPRNAAPVGKRLRLRGVYRQPLPRKAADDGVFSTSTTRVCCR